MLFVYNIVCVSNPKRQHIFIFLYALISLLLWE